MVISIILVSFLIFTIGTIPAKSQKTEHISEIVNSLFQSYDKNLRPSYGENPINVTVSAHILDLYNIDDQNHEFSVNMYLRHFWTDSRLKFNSASGVSEIFLDTENGAKLWVPDTFILNERKSRVHDLTSKNEFTRISSEGEVTRSTRFTVTASCKMNLGWFPFDRHTCTLEIESYAHTEADFIFNWKKDEKGNTQSAVSVSGEVVSLTFKVKAINTKQESLSFSNKTYGRLAVEFFLVRESTKYLQDIYFPAVMLTVISFITLCTGGSFEFRIQLSSFCMIALVIFMAVISSGMPKVTYQTALDFYLFNCVVMIFNVVLVHFGLFHFLKPQRSQGVRMRYMQEGLSGDDGKETLYDGETQSEFMPEGRPTLPSKFKNALFLGCKKSKTMVPLIFVIFNIFYWIIVLIGSSGFPSDFLILEAHD